MLSLIKKDFKKFFLFSLIIVLIGLLFHYGIKINREKAKLSLYIDIEKGIVDDSDEFLYPKEINLTEFYYKGEKRACWYLSEAKNYINAIYYFKDSRGKVIKDQKPIVYIKPGDERYSQFWEIFYVHVPKHYVANSVKNFETILKAEQDKLFRVTFSGIGVNMPIVNKNVIVENSTDEYPKKIQGYYKGELIHFLRFEDNLQVYKNGVIDHIPAISVYRRDDESSLFEAIINKDLNSDEDLSDSMNILDTVIGQSLYSPLHKLNYIHVNKKYPNLSQEDSSDIWKSFLDMTENKGRYINFDKGAGGLEAIKFYYNCPHDRNFTS